MSTKKAPPPGFDYDEETEKFVPLPSFDWKSYLDGNPKKKPPTRSSTSKQTKGGALNSTLPTKPCLVPGVDIDPQTGKYVFTSYEMKDFLKFVGAPPQNPPPTFGSSKQAYVTAENEPRQPSKYRKSTKGVRKELFKSVDSEPKRKERKSITNSNARRGLLGGSSNQKMRTKVNIMSTISEQHTKSNIPVSGQIISQDQSPQPQLLVDDEGIKTPDSVSSEKSFLRMERLCKTPKLQVESPMGTVRKLFDTKLTFNTQDENVPSQSVDIGQNDQSRIIAKLKQVVLLDQQLCQEIAEKQALHAQNLATIKALTDQLAPGDVDKQENKENSVRRSRRLQTTSSPVPLPPRDLRKSVLTNNLVRTGQKSTVRDGSEQKALDMYNSTRKICSALLTPSIKNVNDGQLPNSLQQLSMKVQEQCLMIQDTPCRK